MIKSTQKIVYFTSDGIEHSNINEAEKHEKFLVFFESYKDNRLEDWEEHFTPNEIFDWLWDNKEWIINVIYERFGGLNES